MKGTATCNAACVQKAKDIYAEMHQILKQFNGDCRTCATYLLETTAQHFSTPGGGWEGGALRKCQSADKVTAPPCTKGTVLKMLSKLLGGQRNDTHQCRTSGPAAEVCGLPTLCQPLPAGSATHKNRHNWQKPVVLNKALHQANVLAGPLSGVHIVPWFKFTQGRCVSHAHTHLAITFAKLLTLPFHHFRWDMHPLYPSHPLWDHHKMQMQDPDPFDPKIPTPIMDCTHWCTEGGHFPALFWEPLWDELAAIHLL